MAPKKKKYQIWGRVIEKETKKGVPNITVKAFDKDLRTDDYLGTTVTDKNGRFTINYSESDFRDFFVFDRKPELYLTIYDWLGTKIKTTKDKIRYNAKPREGFYIKLPRSTVSKIPKPKKKVEEKPKKKSPKKMKLKTKGVSLLEIPGIGPSRAKKLKKAGISDATSFSKASEKKLGEILGNLDIKKMKKDAAKVLKRTK